MNTTFSSFSDGLADAIAAAVPSLARVRNGRWVGTAIAVSETELVTARHLVRRADEVDVSLANGHTGRAKVIGRDRGTDLALLQLADGGLQAATWTDKETRVGHLVVALGWPGRARAAMGMVSDVSGEWTSSRGGRIDGYINVEGALPSGGSGGPLLAADGGFIGINTAGVIQGGTTLPGATVDRVVAALRDGVELGPGYLGVGVQRAQLPAANPDQPDQTHGLVVVSVDTDGPGDKGGLQVGDVLLSLDGDALSGLDGLVHTLAGRAGQDAVVAALRGGERIEKTVTLGSRPRRRRC